MRQNLTSICCGSSNATCLVYDYIKCGAIFSWWSTHTIHRTNPLQCLVSFNCQHRTCTWASVTGMDCSTTVLITTLNFKWLLFERRWPRFRFFFFLFCSFLCFLLIQVNLFSFIQFNASTHWHWHCSSPRLICARKIGLYDFSWFKMKT